MAGIDTMGFARAVGELGVALARRPWAVLSATNRYTTDLARSAWAMGGLSIGLAPPAPHEYDPRDRRFRDPAWEGQPWFFGLGQAYLASASYLRDLVEAAALDQPSGGKVDYLVNLAVDAMAPPNQLWGNPTAQRRAVETRGLSLLRGARNLLHDVSTNRGMPSQVDRSAFRVGENLAVTPGKVVFRNELMELIQYAPRTKTVFEVPLLLSPPWINKYYVMDLAPGRSFVEWAVTHGHTVFAISYRNPDESMRDVALDDYLINGPHTALDVMRDITGAEQANIVGLCLGGTLTAMLLAYLAATGEDRVRSATLLNTLVDFSEPGPMGCFLDRESVARLDVKMLSRGYLDSTEMSAMFDLLRARDLIWNYVTTGWLMGEPPPAFDVLAWNADGTRMPADMHSFYLRCCYVENQLARGEMRLAGQSLKLGEVDTDTYLLSAVDDHIAPWKSAYATTRLLGGDRRFVLSSSGHVAGIVNPVPPALKGRSGPAEKSRRRYWTNDDLVGEPETWLEGAGEHQGSWWGDWADWIGARAGARRPPPPMGGKGYRPLADAPGTYVHGD